MCIFLEQQYISLGTQRGLPPRQAFLSVTNFTKHIPAHLGYNFVMLQLPHPIHCSNRQDTCRTNSTKDSKFSPANLGTKIMFTQFTWVKSGILKIKFKNFKYATLSRCSYSCSTSLTLFTQSLLASLVFCLAKRTESNWYFMEKQIYLYEPCQISHLRSKRTCWWKIIWNHFPLLTGQGKSSCDSLFSFSVEDPRLWAFPLLTYSWQRPVSLGESKKNISSPLLPMLLPALVLFSLPEVSLSWI